MSDYDGQSDDPESSVDFDDLLTGWSDEARPPYKSSEDVASAASSAPPLLGPSNPSPHEWLTEKERQDSIAVAAGLLESALKRTCVWQNGGGSRLMKRSKTGDGVHRELFSPPPSWSLPKTPKPPRKRLHRLAFALLWGRARSDPTSFRGAHLLALVDEQTVKDLIWMADLAWKRRQVVMHIAVNSGMHMYLERRGLLDEDIAAVFDHYMSFSLLPPRSGSVYLNDSRFGPKGVHSLSTALSHRWECDPNVWHIQNLVLNNTPIGAAGAVEILDNIVTHPTIGAMLEMSNIGLHGEDDAIAVAHAIKHNAERIRISVLNLGHNNIGTDGVRAIATAVPYLSGIQSLHLCCCGIRDYDPVLDEIKQHLEDETTLSMISMRHAGGQLNSSSRRTVIITSKDKYPGIDGKFIFPRRGEPPRIEGSAFVLENEHASLKVFPQASAEEVRSALATCSQRTLGLPVYITLPGSRFEFNNGDVSGVVLVDPASMFDDMDDAHMGGWDNWAGKFMYLRNVVGRDLYNSSLRLRVFPGGEVKRRAAVMFIMERWRNGGERRDVLLIPKEIIQIILKISTRYPVVGEWHINAGTPLRNEVPAHYEDVV